MVDLPMAVAVVGIIGAGTTLAFLLGGAEAAAVAALFYGGVYGLRAIERDAGLRQ